MCAVFVIKSYYAYADVNQTGVVINKMEDMAVSTNFSDLWVL